MPQTYTIQLTADELQFLNNSLESAKKLVFSPRNTGTTKEQSIFIAIDTKVKRAINVQNDDAN